MQKYELVLMLNPHISDKERKDFLLKFEEEFKSSILQKDDMGIRETSYDIKSIKGNDRIHYVSYYIDSSNDLLDSLRKYLLYSNLIVRYEIFKMKSGQTFFEFDKLQKELQDIVDKRDDKRFGNKVSFLSHKENEHYINWKSIIILKKYLTRFGAIKPRQYTKSKVSTQKKIRKEIIRARGLGLLEFSK